VLGAYAPDAVAQEAPETGDSGEGGPGARRTADRLPERQMPTPERRMPTVEVRGSAQTYDARRYDTATKIVVTEEEILKHGDSTLGDVLKRLPGITIGGVQGRDGAIRMRGLGNGYTQILLNGEPSPPGFSLDSVSPDMIERIEIMRAATAEYSTQAVAGSINIVLKQAVDTSRREVKLGVQHDNGNFGGSVNLQLADRKGPLSYSLSGGVNRGNYERLPTIVTDAGFDPSGLQTLLRVTPQTSQGQFRSLNLAPRLNLNLGKNDTLSSQSFVHVTRFDGNTSERVSTLIGQPPTYAATDTAITSGSSMLRSGLNWVRKTEGGGKLDMKIGGNYNHRDSNSALALQNSSGMNTLNRRIDSSASDKGITGSGKFSTPFAQDHALALGWDGGISQRDDQRIQRETSTVPGQRIVNSDETFQATVKRLAVFAQDEWNITPRWSVYYGLRWEGLDTTSEGNSYAPVHNTSSVWSPVFQTLWKLPDTKADQIRFGVARTYKAPTTNSLIPRRFTSNNNSPTSPDSQGNPNLKPELAWGMDLAYEHFLPGGGLMSASTYVRRIEDITRRTVTLVDGLWVSMPINDGVATTRGIELELKLPVRTLLKTAPAIDLRVNLARNWSTISSVPGPNNRLDQQTPFSGNVGFDYKLDKMPLTMGGNFSYLSGGPVRISENQSAYLPTKRVLDLFGIWKFSPKVQLRVSVSNALHQDNLSDRTYADSSGTLQASTRVPTTAVVRGLMEVKF